MSLLIAPPRTALSPIACGLVVWISVLLWAVVGQAQDGPSMRVDSVTSASPSFAEQGSQVNLWVEGTGFASGAEVSFNVPGIERATDPDGRPLPTKVFLNVTSEGEQVDGIQYFARIAAPQDMPSAPPGFVDVTVTNPDGTSATGRRLLEIVGPGRLPQPRPGEGNIDSISGASPPAAFIGQRVAMWIWGEGIAEGAQITFDNPGVSSFRPSEIVPNSASHPGYAGARNYLVIDPAARPGPVGVTIRNPNGTQVTVPELFRLLEGNGMPGGGGNTGGVGNCPDITTSIAGITQVTPFVLTRGQTNLITIEGLAFACGSEVLISGGGLRALGPPDLYRAPLNPFMTTLTWEIEVGYEAELGERDVSIVNPNGTSKTASRAIQIVDGDADGEASFGCRTAGHAVDPSVLTIAGVVALLGFVRRRRRASLT